MGLMSPADFRAWRGRMGFTQAQAAAALGYRPLQVKRWERAPDDVDEAPAVPVPLAVALACAAIEAGLKPL